MCAWRAGLCALGAVVVLLPGALPAAAQTITQGATITSVAFTNVPPNGEYLTIGNHIEVTVTFNQPVTVTGTPHVRLTWFTSFTSRIVKPAEHIPSASSGASQVFRYTLAEDDSAVRVEVAENALRLSGGTIASGGAAANLNHAPRTVSAQLCRRCARAEDYRSPKHGTLHPSRGHRP